MRIIDMHCDTIMALMQSNQPLRENVHMIDLNKLKKGDYLLQCFAMFVPYASKEDPKYSPFEYCHKIIISGFQLFDPSFRISDNFRKQFEKRIRVLRLGCTSRDDAR